MIKIAICDDDMNSTNFMEEVINNIDNKNIFYDIFLSGAELVKYLGSGQEPYNIYLMDIEMPKQNGIETASSIRKKDKDAVIIFITDYKDYVYDVFEALPFRFIRKPVTSGQLSQVLIDAIEHIQMFGQIFFFQIGHEQYQLHYREIIYFEGAGRKIIIHTLENTFEIYDKITTVYSRLDQNLFCQIHASFIVNMDYIRLIKKLEIVMEDGTSLPISKSCNSKVKQIHLSFIERRCGN